MSFGYVTADLHLGHAKIQGIRGVTDDDLVRMWNQVVTKRDVVYVLGDVFRLDRVPELKGIKKLAMGNHDTSPMARYLEHFSQVRACYEWDNCLLTHIPVHPNQRKRYRLNIHGHLHHGSIDDPWYRCVSVERTGYSPVLLVEAAMSAKEGQP